MRRILCETRTRHGYPLMQRGVPLRKAACLQGRFRWLKRRLTLKAFGKKGKKFNDYWSEWQDLNLRPLRPERSALPG
jgi:hypothetical protein